MFCVLFLFYFSRKEKQQQKNIIILVFFIGKREKNPFFFFNLKMRIRGGRGREQILASFSNLNLVCFDFFVKKFLKQTKLEKKITNLFELFVFGRSAKTSTSLFSHSSTPFPFLTLSTPFFILSYTNIILFYTALFSLVATRQH